ncbi:MAG: hypothetical protein M3Q73_03070 [bacterium]|nr:hypothetical protein [bacterium]
MKDVVVFGAGNIGTTLINRLKSIGCNPKYIVRSKDIFDTSLMHNVSAAFICIPTVDIGETSFKYAHSFLSQGKPVITCEKASIAYHWDELKRYKDIFKYTATVGGGTKMLKELSKLLPTDIHEVKAVVNGTLNFISDSFVLNKTSDDIFREVIEKGYAEPGSTTFDEVIKAELHDVALKTIIMANHSGLFDKTIKKEDVEMVTDVTLIGAKKCAVHITKNSIRAGFIEDNNVQWLPSGVNNVLYINGIQKVYGRGAGADATVSAMLDDFKDVFL